jgi:hypothetical protein
MRLRLIPTPTWVPGVNLMAVVLTSPPEVLFETGLAIRQWERWAWRSIDADGIAGEEKGMAVVIALRAVG